MNIHHPIETGISALDKMVKAEWDRLFQTSPFLKAVQSGEATKALYALYLLETYHYTRHNARNQALVGVRIGNDDPQYQRFCFHHAADEAGHEQMALHDVRSLGVADIHDRVSAPLPETTTLIAYLYWISFQGNEAQRLGYSFWAENCYEYILPLMGQVSEKLGLTTAQTTFFVAHADIDVEHAEQVKAMLLRQCRTPDDWAAVGEVMTTSLRLTGRMMDAVYDQYVGVVNENSDRYGFLRSL